MKKLLFLLALPLLLSSCVPQMVALKGSYLDKPYQITSNKPFEEVWSNVIDMFATKGLAIGIIDKSSGIITSKTTSFDNHFTFENDNGQLENPNAWVVLTKIDYAGTKLMPTSDVKGEWNIRIKSLPNGKSLINVNLTNIDARRYVARTQYTAEQNLVFVGQSTGKFEESIAELIR